MTQQFQHDYTGWNGVRSRCNVMIFSDDGDHFICFENLGIGVSVTNASEMLATQIVAMQGFIPENCRFFETYREYDNETFDEIEYTWKSKAGQDGKTYWEAQTPHWKPGQVEIKNIFLK
jgi:hypothetical protein